MQYPHVRHIHFSVVFFVCLSLSLLFSAIYYRFTNLHAQILNWYAPKWTVHTIAWARKRKETALQRKMHVEYIYSPHKYAHHHRCCDLLLSISSVFFSSFPFLNPSIFLRRRKIMEIKTQQCSESLNLFLFFSALSSPISTTHYKLSISRRKPEIQNQQNWKNKTA